MKEKITHNTCCLMVWFTEGKTIFFSAFLLISLLLIPHLSSADTLRLSDPNLQYEVISHMDYSPGLLSSDFDLEELQSEPFIPFIDSGEELSSGRNYWTKITLFNALPLAYNTEWIIKFPLVLTDASYFVVYEDSSILKGRTGFLTPLASRSFFPSVRGNFGRLHLPQGKAISVFFLLRSDRKDMAPDFRLSLTAADEFYKHQKNVKLFNGVFIGFVLLILIYNLFLFFIARDGAFIYYSLYLAALSVFTIYNTGDLADWLVPKLCPSKPQLISFFKLSTYFIIIGYLAFLRSFLDLNQLMPSWDRWFGWFSYVALCVLLMDGIAMVNTGFNYDVADFFTIGYAILFLLLLALFLLALSKTTDKKRYFIIAGVLAMGVGSVLTVIQRFQTVEFSTLFYKIGTIIEVVIFSLGLAYRQRETEQSKQLAQFELEKAVILSSQQEQEAKRLAELDEAKNRFYTHIAHELRTPLSVIIGITDHLERKSKEGANIPPDWKESLDLVHRNSDQLLQQINSLLDLAKLESGEMKLRLIQHDIIYYLNYLTESFYSLAEENGIRLLFYPEEQAIVMDYDEIKMQQIIYNLLSNAIKFSSRGDKVVLHAKCTEEHGEQFLQIKVSDNGAGIDPDELSDIFNLFYRGDANRPQGSGVGLTLTKELVELMDGRIAVESELGSGAVFTILLPIKNNADLTSPVYENSRKTSPVLPEFSQNDASSSELPLLLIVEDNRDIISFLRKILMDRYQLLTAEDGEAGLEMALEHTPDIIISDIMMPKRNGFELCEALKGDERTSHIPIILLTAKASEADKIKGLRTGADAYLMKPFNQEELFIRLDNLYTLRRKVQAFYQQSADQLTVDEADLPLPGLSIESSFLKKLARIIIENMDMPELTTPVLAQKIGMSKSQVYRKLKALTAKTPTHFIRDLRLHQAQILLKNPDLNISEIAYQTGFNDPNYFSRAFHQQYNISPRDYRNQLEGEQ